MNWNQQVTLALLTALCIGCSSEDRQSSGQPTLESSKRPLADGTHARLVHGQGALTELQLDPKTTILLENGAFRISRSGPMRPAGDALTYVRSLEDASKRGDAVATYKVFLATLDCANTLKPTPPAGVDNGDIAQSLAECEGLLSDEGVAKTDWLSLAAEQGGIEAKLMYPVNPEYTLGDAQAFLKNPERVMEWKQRSMRYLDEAASIGSQDALLALSGAYENGVITRRDPMLAYAYAAAAERVSPVPYLPEGLEQMKSALPAKDVRQADLMIEKTTSTCCKNK